MCLKVVTLSLNYRLDGAHRVSASPINSLSFWCKSNCFYRNIINKCPDPLYRVLPRHELFYSATLNGFKMKNLHTLNYPACAHARYFAECTAPAAPWSAPSFGGCNALLVSRDGSPPHPHPPTEEAGVVVDVWIDRWFQASEERECWDLDGWWQEGCGDGWTRERWKEINERAGVRV